jgi:hypothetical protein
MGIGVEDVFEKLTLKLHIDGEGKFATILFVCSVVSGSSFQPRRQFHSSNI